MLKVAIVGCGKIADEHAALIKRIPGSEIVGVCDREPLMGKQLADRFPVKRCYSDLQDLLSDSKPDVVHITTPPQSHFSLAKLCLESGSNVYVEKPFTVYEHEARTLIATANKKGLKITAGHDMQFCHAARRMRSIVQSGYLGEGPVHMDSYFCYPLGKSAYAGALLGDKKHWVRSLPGKLLQNIISHGIARIAEFMRSESPQVIVHGFTSPLLESLGETEIVDEVRVIIAAEDRTTAYFTFSSQMRPALHQFRIYGTKNGLILDQDQETVIRVPGEMMVSYLEKFVPPVKTAKQYLGNVGANLRKFLARDFHMKAGRNFLIEGFYDSITKGTEPPIPYREILLTAKIMDLIFGQLAPQSHSRPDSGEGMPLASSISNS